jgi:gliding motility-associated lipoprotein GldH
VGSAWNKDSIVTFDLPELDSTKRYDLFINLRDNNNYQYNNLLIVSVEKPTAIQK